MKVRIAPNLKNTSNTNSTQGKFDKKFEILSSNYCFFNRNGVQEITDFNGETWTYFIFHGYDEHKNKGWILDLKAGILVGFVGAHTPTSPTFRPLFRT